MLWENWLSVKIINMSRNGNLLKSKMKMGMEMSRLGCTGSQINDLKCIFIIWIYLLYLILRNFYSCYNTHGTATWIGLHFSLKISEVMLCIAKVRQRSCILKGYGTLHLCVGIQDQNVAWARKLYSSRYLTVAFEQFFLNFSFFIEL